LENVTGEAARPKLSEPFTWQPERETSPEIVEEAPQLAHGKLNQNNGLGDVLRIQRYKMCGWSL